MKTVNDPRFTVPLYSLKQAAGLVGVPRSTLSDWASVSKIGRKSLPPVVSKAPGAHGSSITFAGLVEAHVAAAFRKSGVSMQQIKRSLDQLRTHISLDHALASKKLYTDGSKILYDYASAHDDEQILTLVLTGQRVFVPVIENYLKLITFGKDGYASRLILPITARPVLVVDPSRSFGKPVFIRSGAPMADVLDRFRAGESIDSLVRDFDVNQNELEEVLRAAIPASQAA